jgi:hypothetical protein
MEVALCFHKLSLQKSLSVDYKFKVCVQIFGSFAAKHHSAKEYLKVIHHSRNGRVDSDVQHKRLIVVLEV